MIATGSGFVAALRLGELQPGTVRVVEVDGRSLCIGRTVDGELGAIDNICTHDGGVLGDGELDGRDVECPRHGARYDLLTGQVLQLPSVRSVRAYPVELDGDRVLVGLEPLPAAVP